MRDEVCVNPGNLLKVTEGPNEGKLALLDFGLVSELPAADREAMVSATIHLGNRDWNALVSDFVALGFLPPEADRGLIVPVMEKVLSPYLRGGGAKAFNFQVRHFFCAQLLDTSPARRLFGRICCRPDGYLPIQRGGLQTCDGQTK